ncbi:Plasmodium exported protein, unknown function [Plasmodium relictum]|uniref:Uncharacterized protein n=1 Tax=Plasmodium relictum TaxID=85471 RepID=A0A1J1GN77_PLARL|nr:Plasmodium exported protein, unknown function [Plasmodium relictum]CRG84794.1 Plasmodium exported protein, unknown function [Plasmodium relictum]
MMNRRNNIISNIKKYPRYNNHIIKSFITEDISTLKMYNKGKKEISLNPFIKLIIFVLFIVMLQYSCNLDSCKFLRKSNLESISHLGTERSLAEGEDIKIILIKLYMPFFYNKIFKIILKCKNNIYIYTHFFCKFYNFALLIYG